MYVYTFLAEVEACCAGVTAEEVVLVAAVAGLSTAGVVGFVAGAAALVVGVAGLVADVLGLAAAVADLGEDVAVDFETTCL